jgi:hypothetical protein
MCFLMVQKNGSHNGCDQRLAILGEPCRPILSRVRCIAWFNIPRLWRLQWQQSRTMDHSKHSDIVAENFVDHAIRSFYDLADGRIPVLGDRLTRKREGADLSSAGGDAIHHS